MAKKLLRVNLDTSFSLLGISCHLKDFRFAWTINKYLQLDFKKSKPYTKEKNQEFSHYAQELDLETIYLFANKSQNGFIVTKMKQVDYWMLFKNTLDERAKQHYLTKIRDIDSVLAVFEEENKKIKEYFVF
tara:strand:- start:14191 stop:14583 length:393 start_codon:yes stop_codon:yes gene_type:complete